MLKNSNDDSKVVERESKSNFDKKPMREIITIDSDTKNLSKLNKRDNLLETKKNDDIKEIDNKIEESEKEFVDRKKDQLKEVFESKLEKRENKTDLNDEDSENDKDKDEKQQIKEQKQDEDVKNSEYTAFIPEYNKSLVYIKEKEDLNDLTKYNKFSVFHSEKATFIDEAEHFGEELSLTSNLKIKEVTKKSLVCISEYPMLLDETVEMDKIKLISSKISYNEKKLQYKITFYPKKSVDLTKIFKEKQNINANKKSRIFGNKDAIMEKSLSSKSDFEREKITDWHNGEIIHKKHKEVILITEFQLCIDTIVEVKENEEVNNYFVLKITKLNDGKFKNKLSLSPPK